jgi:glyoxylase-like metal-dependent hydrolase (beta-lactamase superfamily II)
MRMANRFQVGNIEVIAVSDGMIQLPGLDYFGKTAAEWEPHKAMLDENGNIQSPLGCFLIRSGGRTLLIDAGLGKIKAEMYDGGALLDDLASVGVQPEDIDTVFFTHLHADHVGWGARRVDGVRVSTFPNAAYRYTSGEQTYWSGDFPPERFVRKDIFATIAPQFEAADPGASLAPGVDVVGLPGHTPGHAGVVISSGDARAFLLGDAISCPVQLTETEWSGTGDIDPKLARRSQEALMRELEGSQDMMATSHFPGLTFGRVLVGEGKRYWQAV